MINDVYFPTNWKFIVLVFSNWQIEINPLTKKHVYQISRLSDRAKQSLKITQLKTDNKAVY